MPRRFIVGRDVNHVLDRPEDLHLPMEVRRDRGLFCAESDPSASSPRPCAPARRTRSLCAGPELQSRGAIVKIWPASASTTAARIAAT